MLIIPAIDLSQGRPVRLAQGRKDAATVYDGDPVEIAKSFQHSGARMLHVVDLDRAFSGRDSANQIVLRRMIAALEIPVQFGGGLRDIPEIGSMFDLGVARVVIGTLAVESPETIEELVARFGGARVAVGIDAREGQVMIRGWQKDGSVRAVELARRVARSGVERIVYTDVARDGMLTGPNVEQTCLVARESGVRVTASGGVSSLEDLRELQRASSCGVDSVIVGRALYERRFTLSEALQAIETQARPPGV